MNKNIETSAKPRLFSLVLFIVLFSKLIQSQDISITINIRGVDESKFSLTSQRETILKRLENIKTPVRGTKTPN
jgi:hypothetical protein